MLRKCWRIFVMSCSFTSHAKNLLATTSAPLISDTSRSLNFARARTKSSPLACILMNSSALRIIASGMPAMAAQFVPNELFDRPSASLRKINRILEIQPLTDTNR